MRLGFIFQLEKNWMAKHWFFITFKNCSKKNINFYCQSNNVLKKNGTMFLSLKKIPSSNIRIVQFLNSFKIPGKKEYLLGAVDHS